MALVGFCVGASSVPAAPLFVPLHHPAASVCLGECDVAGYACLPQGACLLYRRLNNALPPTQVSCLKTLRAIEAGARAEDLVPQASAVRYSSGV